MEESPNISFVCCVEAGVLESQTIRMVRSFRSHGGRFSSAPIIAVTPRPGPKLSKATRRAFDELHVQHVTALQLNAYDWFNFLNKPLALQLAEKYIGTESAAWLDGDLLFVAEPNQLELAAGEDFAGFPVESKEMGTCGPGDPYEPLWIKACEVLGIDLQALPFVVTAQTHERVRLYFNGGIFVYRRNSGFSQSYLENCIRLLDSKIGTDAAGYNLGFKEMSAIGFSVIKLGLSWRALPYSHDYVMLSSTHERWYDEAALREAKVVHYHDAMWPHFWPTFSECVERTHPDVAAWLKPLGPMRNEAGWGARLQAKWLKRVRSKKALAYAQSCTSA